MNTKKIKVAAPCCGSCKRVTMCAKHSAGSSAREFVEGLLTLKCKDGYVPSSPIEYEIFQLDGMDSPGEEDAGKMD
jgi:hypothetical protein